MGNPYVRFDEGRERIGHWPIGPRAFQPNLSCLLYQNASRNPGAPASNPTLRVIGRCNLAAVRLGLVRYARAGETVRAAGASRHRAARAREVWVMES